jgi:hypothetical protein
MKSAPRAVVFRATQGLLTFMTDQSFLQNSTLSGGAGYGLQNFIGVGLLGVWLIFSTIAVPIIIQKALTEGYQAGAALLTGATGAALSGLATGATTAAALGASGGNRWATAGLAATAGAAAATNAVAGSAFTDGHGASLINTLAYQNERVSARSKGKGESSSRFDANDVTGAKAVRNLIDGTRGSDSPKSNS